MKLSEGGFTPCGGAESRRNDRREPCDSAARLFADPSACYLRRPAHAVRDRRYWTIFEQAHGSLRAAFPGCGDAGPCPFRGEAQQPMRNHALLLGLEQAAVIDFGALGLVHHDANPDVPPAWDRYAAMVADPARLFRIPASEVASAAGLSMREWSDERYFLTAHLKSAAPATEVTHHDERGV